MDGENTTRNEALEQHLLFHKALIDDDTGTERIDKYMDILSGDTEGERMLLELALNDAEGEARAVDRNAKL